MEVFLVSLSWVQSPTVCRLEPICFRKGSPTEVHSPLPQPWQPLWTGPQPQAVFKIVSIFYDLDVINQYAIIELFTSYSHKGTLRVTGLFFIRL